MYSGDLSQFTATKFKQCVYQQYQESFHTDIANMSSLKMFKLLKESTHKSPYLYNSHSNFKAIQLKFRLRTGVLGLGEDLYRQNRGDGLCQHCLQFESAYHFILQCPAYSRQRVQMYNDIKEHVNEDLFSAFLADPFCALSSLLGDCDDAFNMYFLKYLRECWLIRSEMI